MSACFGDNHLKILSFLDYQLEHTNYRLTIWVRQAISSRTVSAEVSGGKYA